MGGLTFLCDGRMCGGVLGRDLVVRVGRDEMEAALRRLVRPMDFTGRPLASSLTWRPRVCAGRPAFRRGSIAGSPWRRQQPLGGAPSKRTRR